jgi:hypothetical protein
MNTLLFALIVSQGAPAKLDLTPERRLEFRLLADGKGHYLAWDRRDPTGGQLFYGDGKSFSQVPVRGGGSSGVLKDDKGLMRDAENFSMSFWEPRFSNMRPSFDMKEHFEEYSVTCGSRTTKLTEVKTEEAEKLMKTAALSPSKWTRLPEELYRDDSGVYYFVDRLRVEERRDLRLFMGQKGKMKLMPLKDIVDDSKGTIFATKNGQLRLITGSGEWIVGNKKKALTKVPVDENAALIYTDLGPYNGERLGTPCDDL